MFHLRAKVPVSRVRFAGGAEEAAGDDGEQQRGFFGSQETFFVTHYDEVISTLLDHRFAVDPHSTMSPEIVGSTHSLGPTQGSVLAIGPGQSALERVR